MKVYQTISTAIVLFLMVFSSCIGTDLVDELIGEDRSQLILSERQLGLELATTFQLEATYFDFNGAEETTNLTWSSQDATIAEVDASGLVTAIGIGQTNILVVAEDGNRDSAFVAVVADANTIAKVRIEGSIQNLTPGETTQLQAVAWNAAGDEVSTPSDMIWQSADPSIATVSTEGLVTAIAIGSTNISASIEGILSLPYDISVGSSLRTGTFSGKNGYTVNGTVTIEPNGDGFAVNLGSDFQSSSGPGLYLYLTTNASNINGSVELGALQSTSGTQSYAIPQGTNPDEFSHILVYCKPFGVPFGVAELQ